MAELTRCVWAQSDPPMRAYHDEEWGVPERDPRALWEKLMLDGFQAGLAWITVLRKRDAFRAAFKDFEPDKTVWRADRLRRDKHVGTPRMTVRGLGRRTDLRPTPQSWEVPTCPSLEASSGSTSTRRRPTPASSSPSPGSCAPGG